MSTNQTPMPNAQGIEQLNEQGEQTAISAANVAAMALVNPALQNYWAAQVNLASGQQNPNPLPASIQWETFLPNQFFFYWTISPEAVALSTQTVTWPIPPGTDHVENSPANEPVFVPHATTPTIVGLGPNQGAIINVPAQQAAQAAAAQNAPITFAQLLALLRYFGASLPTATKQ